MPASFRFYQRTDRPNKKGECPIYLRITHNRKKKYYNTGIKIDPSDWHDEKEKVRRSHRTYRLLNDELDILLDEAKEAARLLRRENKLSASAVKDRLIGATNENFFMLAQNHLQELERNKQFYLRKQTKATIKKLKEFNGSKNLLFTEINSRYLSRFQDFMKKKYGNKGSTIRKNMGDMRRIIKLAKKKQLIFNNPFQDVEPVTTNKPKYKPKLSLKQIADLEKLSLPEGSMIWHARNAFVLSFYFCGMRFGDLATLRWENVANGKLEYQMSKTGTNINVKILDGAKPFLELYQHEDATAKDFILPFCKGLEKAPSDTLKQKISSCNAYVNNELKEAAKKAGIKVDLSMHVARHSFAQYGATKDISLYKMMILLGHQSVRTTENYLDTINVQIGNETLDEIF